VDHIGELPEQIEQNMRGLDNLGMQLRTRAEDLRVAEARRSDLARSRAAADSEAGRLIAAEDGLSRAVVAARSTWTEDHPEVRRLESELAAIHDRRVDAEGRMSIERSERARAVQQAAAIQTDLNGLQRQVQVYQGRLERTPRWAHELSVMARDYDITRTKYQSVISRKVEAELSHELEVRGAKSLFHVVSPALVSSDPAKPDRWTGLLISFAVALGLAVLTAVVLETRDDSVRQGAELGRRLTIPVLAVVPQMSSARGAKRVLMPARAAPAPGSKQ
jgi:uncharacterized protein involved in exopolysaccharide biosynthesis